MQTVGMWSGRIGSTAGAAPARWAVLGVAAFVAVSPDWPGSAAPGLSVAIAAVLIAVTGLLPPTGAGRWFRFAWRRWTTLGGRPVAGWELPVALPAVRSSDSTEPGRAPPIDVLAHRGRLLALVDLRPGGTASRSAPILELLAPLLKSAGVAVESIQWLQLSTHRRRGDPVDARRRTEAGHHGVGTERTLIVLRIDPGRNGPAITARGGGERGARRLVAVTVARAVSLLAPTGVRPQLLDGAAALQTVSEVRGTPSTVPRRTGRRSETRPIEQRDRLLLGGRHHRMWHWHGSVRPLDERRSIPAGTLHDALPRWVSAKNLPAHVVWSSWIAAGPHGIRHGGAIRLSADSVAELEELEHALHERMPPDTATLHHAIDDQVPLFPATLPYGGPP